MNVSKFDDIWKLMSKYTFKMDSSSIDNDLSCLICKNLMLDACQSICGCQFCHKCISEYLKDGDRYCPGNKAECKDECLSLERDLSKIVRLNNKIAKTIVKCPNHFCELRMELLGMDTHLRICSRRSFTCPYASIGCQNESECRNPRDSSTYLQGDAQRHSNLLIESINNLKNEVNGIKNNFEMCKLEIASLREESRIKDMQFGKILAQIEEQKLEIEVLKEESLHKKNSITILEEELRNMKEKFLEMVEEREKRMRVIEEVPGPELLRNVKLETNRVTLAYNILKKEINQENEMRKSCDETRDRRMDNCITLFPNMDQDFVWRSDECMRNVGTLTERRIFSKSFYSNDYKLCLRMYIYADNIGLSCVIMKGDNDDKLKWPLRHAVKLSLIDQDTLRTYKSVIFKYETYHNRAAFDKSKSNMNYYGIGARPFILYSDIKDVPSIIVNDSIVVSCALSSL